MELVNKIIDAIIAVCGEDRWNALTGEQQHDAIMDMVKLIGKTHDIAMAMAKEQGLLQ